MAEHHNRLSNAIVVFIDILGFKDFVDRASKDGKWADLLISTISRSVRNTSRMRSDAKTSRIATSDGDALSESAKSLFSAISKSRVTHFSDSIVWSVRYSNDSEYIAATNAVLGSTRVIMRDFADKGLFVRGGVTSGLLYHSGNVLLGPAMNRAYELESKVAKYPRIIVDDCIVNDSRLPGLGQYITQDWDGAWYLDLVKLLLYGIHPRACEPLLRTIVDKVQTELHQVKSDDVRLKYLWLAMRLNGAIGHLHSEGRCRSVSPISISSDRQDT